jgi:hypothetical protein
VLLVDDAYITLNSALALVSGHDPRYPGTPALYGATSPVHVVLVALLSLALPGTWPLVVASAIGAGLYGAALIRLARNRHFGLIESTMFLTTGVGAGWLFYHLFNGLETSLAIGLLAWSIVFHSEGRTRRGAALAGLLPYVRPELALWSALVLCDAIRQNRREAVRVVSAAAVAAGPWALLLMAHTGGIVPTSISAKANWFAMECLGWAERGNQSQVHLGEWALLSAGVLPGIVGLARRPAGRLFLVFGTLLVAIWFVSAPGLIGGYQRYRYQALLVPGMAIGLAWLPTTVRSASMALGTALAAAFLLQFARTEPAFSRDVARERDAMVAMLTRFEAEHVLVHDAGYVAFAGPSSALVDMVGVKTPEAAALNAQWTRPTCGAERWRALGQLVAASQVRFVLVWDPWDNLYGITSGLKRAGWESHRLGRTPGHLVLYRLLRAPQAPE